MKNYSTKYTILLSILISSTNIFAQKIPQPQLGYRSAKVLKKSGLDFKDLNHNCEYLVLPCCYFGQKLTS